MNAAIVALFFNAVYEVYSHLNYLGSVPSNVERLRSYMPITREMVQDCSRSNADSIRFMRAKVLFQDFEKLFSRFKCECHLDEISEATGLKTKFKNTIVQPWAMRIKENVTQHEFNVLLVSGH